MGVSSSPVEKGKQVEIHTPIHTPGGGSSVEDVSSIPSTTVSSPGTKPTTQPTSADSSPPRKLKQKISFYPNDTRGSELSIKQLRELQNGMMAETIHKEQTRKLWTMKGPEEGVIIKFSRGEYLARPESLQLVEGGLFQQIMALNVKCAMTIKTHLVAVLLSKMDAENVSLGNGNYVQVLPRLDCIPECAKHQFAAFIQDKRMLVVWDDDPAHLITRADNLEKMLLHIIWRNHDAFGDDPVDEYEKPIISSTTTAVPSEKTSPSSSAVELSREDDDTEALSSESRKIVLLSPTIVACTLTLLLAALGTGFRAMAMEISITGSYTRLVLLVTTPLEFFVGLFMMQSIIGCLFQMFAPVSQMNMNSKAYSGKAPRRVYRDVLPHITIQMPVYKEGLNAVIKPTVQSLKEAISTYELQGGTANIFINDDGMQLISETEAIERREFYEEHNIGWVARPKHNPKPKNADASFDDSSIFVRKGKFKKASNMNFALMVSNRIEEKLVDVVRTEKWTQKDEEKAYRSCMADVLHELQGVAWAEGNIRMGDYILIVDSDTRVPTDCLLDAANEMEASPEIAILQFSSGVMKVTDSFFEDGIKFFTDLVYTAIRFAVASGDVCPFVGHNAILRWSALQQVTFEEDGYEKFWSESHVSEDFDMALRLQTTGYSIRLAAYQGEGFKEGVSLTVYDELARWEKYAYGCSELIFHPLRFWIIRGPFTPLFRKFIFSSMPIGAKLTIMAYIGTYYAIGAAWFLTLLNYFLAGWFVGYVDKFYLGSFQIYVSIVVVFSGLGNIALAVLRYRTSEKGLLASLCENFKWIFLLTIFLGGISIHVSQALLSHLFEIDMSWGATSKEVENATFFSELPKLTQKFKFTFVFCFAMIALIIGGVFFFPVFWRITTFNAIYPLCSIVFSHLMLPIALNPALMMFSW